MDSKELAGEINPVEGGETKMPNVIELNEFSPDEQLILKLIAEGIRQGRKEYGPLDLDDPNDNRNLYDEAIFELRDAYFYRTAILAKEIKKLHYEKIKNFGKSSF